MLTDTTTTPVYELTKSDKKISKARKSCDKALEILDPDAADQRDLAQALTHSAWLDLDQGQNDSALERAQRAWKLRQEYPSQKHAEGRARFVLGLALHAKGRTAEGRQEAIAAKQAIEAGEPGSRYDLEQIDAFLAATEDSSHE